MKESDYIYLSSKIKVLESKILNRNDIERMINSTDLDKAFKVLDDTDYSDNLLGLAPEDYREALVNDMQQLHDFLQKVTPDQDLFKLMMLPKDFGNLKLLFKAELFQVEVDHIINSNAAYHSQHPKDMSFENHINYPEAMKAYIQGQKDQTLDEDIKEVIQVCLKNLSDKSRPDEVDALLTRHYYDLSMRLAERMGNQFILDYFKTSIDVANLIIFIRSRRLKLKKERLKTKLIPGGRIDISKILRLYPDEVSGLKSSVRVNFNLEVAEAFDSFCENKKIFQLERVLENYKAGFTKNIKNKSYGPDVVFAYYLNKINASYNIGIILTGKLNQVPIEEIRKTLRESY